MMNSRTHFLALFALVLATACGDDSSPSPAADASPPVPIDPSGHYAVTSTFSLSAPPLVAVDVLAELDAATAGPDDPSRYLIDLMIAKIPDNTVRIAAGFAAPYVAGYLNQRIASVAPEFATGIRALSANLSRIAQRFGTIEQLDIVVSAGAVAPQAGDVRRTIVGYRFELQSGHQPVDVRFAQLGLGDLTANARMTFDGSRLTLERSAVTVQYTKLLRLGLDFAAIPAVVAGKHDLSQALDSLVDCNQLGSVVAGWIELGSPSLYATACRLGLSALADRIYGKLDAIEGNALALEVTGQARALDENGDGPMDRVVDGTWTGTFASATVNGTFDGRR